MREFAKIINTAKFGQVLITKLQENEGTYSLTFQYYYPGESHPSFQSLYFTNNQTGLDVLEATFNNVNESVIEALIEQSRGCDASLFGG